MKRRCCEGIAILTFAREATIPPHQTLARGAWPAPAAFAHDQTGRIARQRRGIIRCCRECASLRPVGLIGVGAKAKAKAPDAGHEFTLAASG